MFRSALVLTITPATIIIIDNLYFTINMVAQQQQKYNMK